MRGLLTEPALLESQTDWQAACVSRSGCLSRQFPAPIDSKQYKCVPPLAPDPITPRGFLPAPSISTAETYYCVLSEVALAPDLSSPPLLLFFFLHFPQMCMTTCLQRFYNCPLDVRFPVISQAVCWCPLRIVWQHAWLACAAWEG